MSNSFKWIPLTTGMTVLVLSLALSVLVVTGKNTQGLLTNQNVRSQAAETLGSLQLSPSQGDDVFSAGQSYPVGVIVDSAGRSVDGVDVILNFDPKKVQVVDNAVSPTSIFEKFLVNRVDNVSGKIQFSALTFSPKPMTGIVATFRFRPLGSGTVNFNFDFTPGSTTDSNIAEHGTARDILGKVQNGKYDFK